MAITYPERLLKSAGGGDRVSPQSLHGFKKWLGSQVFHSYLAESCVTGKIVEISRITMHAVEPTKRSFLDRHFQEDLKEGYIEMIYMQRRGESSGQTLAACQAKRKAMQLEAEIRRLEYGY